MRRGPEVAAGDAVHAVDKCHHRRTGAIPEQLLQLLALVRSELGRLGQGGQPRLGVVRDLSRQPRALPPDCTLQQISARF